MHRTNNVSCLESCRVKVRINAQFDNLGILQVIIFKENMIAWGTVRSWRQQRGHFVSSDYVFVVKYEELYW